MFQHSLVRWGIGLGVLGLAVSAMAVDGTEVPVTIDQVPAAVKAAILKESAGNAITEIEQSTQNGVTVYEAEFMLNNKEIEIRIDAEGKVLGREEEEPDDDEDDLKLEQLPVAVRSALMKLFGSNKLTELSRETEDGVELIEAGWSANGIQYEAVVTQDGTLVESEETVSRELTPAAVRAVIDKQFAAGTPVKIVKKMIVVYEAESRVNGQEHEILIYPTGRVEEEMDDDDQGEDDDDDDEEDDDGEDDE